MAPNKLLVLKFVCRVENVISILEPNIAEIVRQDVCTILRNTRPVKKNLNTQELKALIELKRDGKFSQLIKATLQWSLIQGAMKTKCRNFLMILCTSPSQQIQ
ncbi:hypothetical protein Trydic_g9538 [Trypoxylus dichotomus]